MAKLEKKAYVDPLLRKDSRGVFNLYRNRSEIGDEMIKDFINYDLNRYLSEDERTRALSIHRTLLKCKAAILAEGLAAAPRILEAGKADITAAGGKVDYLEVLDSADLEVPDDKTREVLLAAAAFFGTTRLIDNELFEVQA